MFSFGINCDIIFLMSDSQSQKLNPTRKDIIMKTKELIGYLSIAVIWMIVATQMINFIR